jgi:hypothetical protein
MSRKSKKIDTAGKRYKANEPLQKNTARALFYINAALWLGYVVYIYYDMAVVNNNATSADIATIFVFINAIAMFTSGIMLGKLKETSYYVALVVVILNTVLTITNLADLFFLTSFIIDVVILWQLYHLRKSYLLKS